MFMLAGCYEEPILLSNGLTKEADSIKEIYTKVVLDSIGHASYDTISITDRFYNNENKIIKRKQDFPFDKTKMETDYNYNDSSLISQEVVWMSYDSSEIIVDYHYENTILISTISKSETSEINYTQETFHTYYNNGKQKEIRTNYIFIFPETADTTIKQEIDYFNKDGIKIKSEMINGSDEQSRKYTIFKYVRQFLRQTKSYNYKDSLISKTNFNYEMDSFENWIVRESIENGKIIYKSNRIIEYR